MRSSPGSGCLLLVLVGALTLCLDYIAGNAADDPLDASESSGLELDGLADLPFDHDEVVVP